MSWLIFIAVYAIGIPCWVAFEKRAFPYEDGDYTIDCDGAREVTRDMWKDDVKCRAVVWPVCAAFLAILLPFMLLDILFDLL